MIKCAHCKNRHETVAEVRTCALPSINIEKIEEQMHAMVAAAEKAEDAAVYAAKAKLVTVDSHTGDRAGHVPAQR